jgi:hypothetical protein
MGGALDLLTKDELELRIAGKKTKKAGLVTFLFHTISRAGDEQAQENQERL